MGATQISINRGMDKENAVLLYIMKYYSAIKQNEKKKKSHLQQHGWIQKSPYEVKLSKIRRNIL